MPFIPFSEDEISKEPKTFTPFKFVPFTQDEIEAYKAQSAQPVQSAQAPDKPSGLTSTSTKKTAVSTGGPGKTPNIQPVHSAVSTHTAGISNDYAVPEIDTAGMSSDEIKRQIQRLEDTIAIERNRAVATKPQEELNGFQKMLGALSTPEQRRKAAELPSARLQQNDKVKRLESQLNDLKADQYYRSREAEYNQLSEREKEDLAFAVASQNLAVEGAGNTKSADIVEKYLRKYGAEFGSLPYDLTAYPDEIRRLTREQSETFATLMDARMRQTLEKKGLDYDFLMEYGTRLYNQEKREADKKKNELAAQEHPIASNVGSVLATLGKPAGFFNTSRHYFSQTDSDEYIPLDINSPDFGAANYQSDIREKTAENIDSNAGKFLYQTGMSIADFVSLLPLNLVPGGAAASTAILGSGAATDTAIDVANRGGTVSQAFLSGIAAGAAEAVFEKFSLDAILKAGKVTGIKSFIKEFLKGAGVEGSEEAATEIANILSDHAIMGDKSNYSVSVQSYIDSGMTREQAEKAAMEDLAKQVGMAFAGGVVSGGAIHGVQGGVSLAQQIGAKAKGHPATPDADFSASGLTSETGSREVPVARIPQNGSTVNAAGTSASPRPDAYQVADMSAQAKKSRSDAVRETGAAYQVDPAIIDTVAKAAENTGRNIQFVETLGPGRNGKYDASTGTLYVAADSRNPVMTVLRHELTHSLEGTQAYAELSDYITTQIAAEAELNLEDIIEAKIAQYAESGEALTRDGAIAELVADYAGDNLFTSDAAIRRLSAEKPSVARRILNWIRSMKTRLFGTREAKMLARAEQLYHDALMAPFRKGDGVQYKLNPNFQSEYDAWVKDGRKSGGYFRLGTTSEALESIGINPANIYWDKSKINRIQKDHPEMTDAVIKAVPQMLEDPMLVMQSLTVPNRVVVFGDLAAENGKPVLAALELRPSGEIENVIKVASAYSKSTLQNLIDNSDILYVHPNKNRTDSWLEARRLQLPVGLTNYGSIGNVTYTDRNVNGEYTFEGNTPQKTAMQLAFEQAGRNNTNTSISENASDDAQYSRGVSSGDTIADIKAMVERYRKRADNPVEIGRLTPQDADTTPPVTGSQRDTGTGYTVPAEPAAQGDSESHFTENVGRSSIFDDRFKKLSLEDAGIHTYDSITNKDTLNAANKKLNDGGYRAVTDWFSKPVSRATPEDIATGIILLSRYQLAGDYEGMVNAARRLRKMGTAAGQTVQEFSILGRMTPEGMAYYAQKSLDEAFEAMVKNRSQSWVNKNADKFQLTDEDIQFIMDKTTQASKLPEGRDKSILLGEIAARIQNKIPPEKGQNIRALARISMLLNPKTNVRNVLGNVSITPVSWLDDLIGTAVDKAVARKTGKRTTGLFNPKSFKGLGTGVYESFDDFRRGINTRDIDADRFEIGRGAKSFNEYHTGVASVLNPMSKALNALDRTTSFLLEAGDRGFFEMWFMNSLNNQMKLNGVKTPTAEMVEVARQDALSRTWQDTNGYTKFVSGVKKALNAVNVGGYGLGDVFIKFTKTPANLTKALVDYSPVGLTKAIAADGRRFYQAATRGEATPQLQRRFVNSLSKGITGSLLMILFAALADRGILQGKGDADSDVAEFEKNILGIQPYSVKIGDKSYSYEWMQPIGGSAAIVADIVSQMKGEKPKQYFKGGTQAEEAANSILSAIQSGGQVLYDQSFMQSLANLFESDGLVQGLLDGILAEPSVFVPQIVSQTSQLLDDTARRSYVSGRPLETAENKILARTPWRTQLEPVVDTLGREVAGNNNVWDAYFNPATTYTANPTPAAEEMYRVYQETGDKRVIPPKAPNSISVSVDGEQQTVSLTAQQKTAYQKTTGSIASREVNRLLQSSQYRQLSETDKAGVLADIYAYANAVAKSEVSEYTLTGSNAKIAQAEDAGISVADYLILSLSKDADGNGTVSQKEMRQALDASDFTTEQKSVLWQLQNAGWKTNPYGSAYQETDIDRLLRGALS